MPRDVNLEIHHHNDVTAVKLDGKWIPVHSINIDFVREKIPIAAVELEISYADIDGTRIRAYLHPETVRLLKAAGWTPPKEEES